MASPFFSDLDLNDFEEDESVIDNSVLKSCSDLDRKRPDVSSATSLTTQSCREQTVGGNDLSFIVSIRNDFLESYYLHIRNKNKPKM